MARTIPLHLLELPSDGLGALATTRTIRSQLMAQRHYKESPIRTYHGTHPSCSSTHQSFYITICDRQITTNQRSTSTSSRSHQMFARTHDPCLHTLHPLLCGRKGLARHPQSQYFPPINQISPLTLRTLHGYTCCITHLIPPGIASTMESTPRLPCLPSYTIQRNEGTWPQLYGTTP